MLLLTMLAALLLGRGMPRSSPAALIICCLSMAGDRSRILVQVRCCLGKWSLRRSCLQLVTCTGCGEVMPVLWAQLFDRAACASLGRYPQPSSYMEGC